MSRPAGPPNRWPPPTLGCSQDPSLHIVCSLSTTPFLSLLTFRTQPSLNIIVDLSDISRRELAGLGPDWICVVKSKGEKGVNLGHMCLTLVYLGAEVVAGCGEIGSGGGVGEGGDDRPPFRVNFPVSETVMGDHLGPPREDAVRTQSRAGDLEVT